QETLRELEQGASRVRQRRRRMRREERAAERAREQEVQEAQEKVLRVTEFISTGELANLMNVPVNEVISALFGMGMIVSINQRLDADTITLVAEEFGYDVEFITELSAADILIEEDDPEDLEPRAPVVTVMGHVDHGKTSLLDYIRNTNVVAGEAGGITQHIGAYHVELENGRHITFLDTPGHEAFTAMRARGAQVTDVVILVVAADDAVMPQTIEAINHARAAGVPIVVAINKIDKPGANPQRVMQQLADHGVLVEQYGGKVQCSLVSAKTGEGIDDLMEKVLLEAELLDLKANPNRNAYGTVIEARLEKGRGNVATVLVQNGTLKVGDAFVVGIHSGRVRAMFDERDRRIEAVGPARPALVLGLDGAPEVGDQFVVLDDEREARAIAAKRQQIYREQTLRQRKHITLDEIGRRLALGDFKELNIIVKADVGGSVEALSDALLKLSTDEVKVNIIHKGVGAITESDVMLASASDAVIIGFQVRPMANARALAEREEIDIRIYSIIYDAIEEVRDALEGMLSPVKSEKITGVAEVRETFKVPKVGTVAGCYVTEGKIRRSDRIRLIRDGVVIYEGNLSSLKRFKDDVREVASGYECGMGIENYNDIKVGDQIEAFEIVETKRTLEEA
ncbi:MAG: translation initiation factor IF-2, partial [Bacteroidetes bacterium]